MFKFIVLASFVACALGSVLKPVQPQLTGRIVGGEETTISNFPYQLSLMRKGSHSCGASLLSPTIALTAAHCVYDASTNIFSIRAGSTSRRSGGIVVQVADLVIHPLYDPEIMIYDAAVLLLSEALPLGEDIQTIELVTKDPADGTKAFISGWGYRSSMSLFIPKNLRATFVKIVSNEICGSTEYDYGNKIKPTMICAAAIGKDTCQGDSGGPLAVESGLAGIVSWGMGCALKQYPGVYASVAELRPWILETAGELLRL